jgi:U4/U6 small nuclear ribonucleoprotein PRP31
MNTLADEFLLDMNDLNDDGPAWSAIKKEEGEDMQVEGKDLDATPMNTSKITLTEINDLLNEIQRLSETNGSDTGSKVVSLKSTDQSSMSMTISNPTQRTNLEQALIVRSNEMVARINLEIANMYKVHIREMYSKRFPELEHQVFHALDYARVVRKLGNNLTKINELSDILPASNIITISMTASSTSGKDLSEEELEKLYGACDFVLELDESRQKILAYVESKMKIFAPNLTEIVGSEIAAKLIGAAGSLQTLATMPAQNIQVLGRTKKNLMGLSKLALGSAKLGYVGECEIVQATPPQFEVKAVRIISNKCSLAARLDLCGGSKQSNGEVGVKFREEIEKAIEKWQEAPPARKDKPLRAPDDIVTKRRGGAKMRKKKERYAQTELSKRANRLPFAKLTEDHGNSLKSLGMLGLEGSGQIRMNVRDDKGMKLKKKKVKGDQTAATQGFATSVYAITPMQGLELRATTHTERMLPPPVSTTSYFANTGFINSKK